MSAPTEEVTRWAKARMDDIRSDGTISRIDVIHAIEGEPSEVLAHVKVSDGDEYLDIAQDLWDACDEDVSTRSVGRMQRYVFLAYASDDDNPVSRKALIMQGKLRSDMVGGDTEGPTPQGLHGQMMRHTEQLQTRLIQLTDVTTGRMARDLETERNRSQRLEEQQLKMMEMMHELENRAHERKLEQQRETAKEKRHEQLMGMVMTVAPLAAARILGGGAAGAAVGQLPAAGARDAGTHEFLKSLTPDEIQKVLGCFPMEKQMALMALYEEHRNMEEASGKDEDE